MKNEGEEHYEVEMVGLDQLKEADYNPRKIDRVTFARLVEDIDKQGILQPIIVNKKKGREGIIVGGHQRFKAARELGLGEVPVYWVELSEEEERDMNLRQNKVQGKFDNSILFEKFNVEELVKAGWKQNEIKIKEFEKKPDVEFAKYINESNNYVVLIFTNDLDWLAAKNHFGLKTVASKRSNGKPWSKGVGRVLDGAEYLEKIKK